MEFFANLIRSYRMNSTKKELDRLPDEHLADLGVSRLGLLVGDPRLGTEVPRRAKSSPARRTAGNRRSSWEIKLG